MIRVTGIRINNYLRKKDSKELIKVAKIELPGTQNNESCKINNIIIDNLEGIPLNDDLLLSQCNFTVRRNISCIVLALLLKNIDQFCIEDKFILIKEGGEYKLYLTSFSTESCHGVEEKKINYLHQLQNVYYDITLEDLTIMDLS